MEVDKTQEKGQANIIGLLIGSFMLLIGSLILLTIWSPLYAVIYPLLANTETIQFGAVGQLLLGLIPLVFIGSGLFAIFSSLTGGRSSYPPYQ